MLAEGSEALDRFKANMLYFSDDLVLFNRKRAKELATEIRTLKRPIQYSVSARFDLLDKMDDDLLLEMKETGCRIMGLGIESGSDRVLKVVGKKFSSETILNGLERLKNVGILPTVSIMVGQDTETVEDAEASIELMRKSVRYNPHIQYAFTLTTPFPGSQLYDHIFREGLLKDHQEFYDKYFSTDGDWAQVVNLSNMTENECLRMYKKIQDAYQQEKTKALGRKGVLVGQVQVFVGKVDKHLSRLIISKLRGNRLSRKLSDLYNSIFEALLYRLEKRRLKLQGIS